jgi:UDP-N-acetylglucosamine acyltransferase
MVAQDVPPFCTVQGDRARLVALNNTGLQRAGIAEDEIMRLKRAFRSLFRGTEALAARMAEAATQSPHSSLVAELLDFVAGSKRGVVSMRSARAEV